MLNKPLYEYNKAGSSLLLPAPASSSSTPVIDCRSLSTPITTTPVHMGAPPACVRAGPRLIHCTANSYIYS